MKYNSLLLFIVAFFFLCAFTEQKVISFSLGEKKCTVKYRAVKNAVATLLSLHDDENTAIEAYEGLPESIKFNLFELQQNNVRRLAFQDANGIRVFDPNRIFSTIGVRNTLQPYNAEVATKIKSFGTDVLQAFKKLNPNSYIVAIHNNTNNGQLSIKDFIKPNKYHQDAKAVSISSEMDIDDFFLVTEREDFEYLKKLNQNVVLQSEAPNDDGSLSVYCEKNNIPYINIEAENQHKEIQVEMLKIVFQLLKNKKH